MVLLWVVILIQERSEIINDLIHHIVVWSLGVTKEVAFPFENTQNCFDVAVITMHRLNDRQHWSPSFQQHLVLSLYQRSLPIK
jgi:hypothetical protein